MKGSHKGFAGLSDLWIKGQSSLYIYIYIYIVDIDLKAKVSI